MKKVSNKLLVVNLLVLFLFASVTNAFSQETKKYDYAEIIVIQKVNKKKSEIKKIYLNSCTDSSLDKSEIEKIENISSLLKLMNEKNWEYVERLGSQPSNTGPIWINYTFRKKK